MKTLCSQRECMEFGCAFPDCLDDESKAMVEKCAGCRKIVDGKMYPSHDGSSRCESGSIASGGNKSHCSCDVCF